MKIPKRGEKGFTLVELLIVLAILAVLAAVVIPNVLGMFGRGAAQAYDTDEETLQMAVATYYFDIHRYDSDAGWNEADGLAGHYQPNELSTAPAIYVDTATDFYLKGNVVHKVMNVTGPAHLTAQGTVFVTLGAPIWMGLLANLPGDGDAVNPETPEESSPLAGEKGPYLNEPPKSSSYWSDDATTPIPWGNGNPDEPGGTYTWIIDRNGKVWGASFITAYPNPDDTGTSETGWFAGFNGTYP